VLERYKQFSIPSEAFVDGLKNISKHIKECISYLDPDSSPGVPLKAYGTSNSEVLETFGVERLITLVYSRLLLLLHTPLDVLKAMSAEQLVQGGYCDPVRVFIKNEPTKGKKVVTKRWRLIHSVSIVDKLIELVLFRSLMKIEIKNWRTIPSKPGIGFEPVDNELVYNTVKAMERPCESDVSGWDFSVAGWQILDDGEDMVKLCGNPVEEWVTLARAKVFIETRAVYQLSDGRMIATNYDGIVHSGKQRTSSSNSRMRVKLAYMAGAEDAIAAGDDCIESYSPGAREFYELAGFKMKGYTEVSTSFEFCSHKYMANGSHAVNDRKMIFHVLHAPVTTYRDLQSYIHAFYQELGTHPDYPSILLDLMEAGLFELEGAQNLYVE